MKTALIKDLCYGNTAILYGSLSLQMGDAKVERFLPKNQHTQKEIIEL